MLYWNDKFTVPQNMLEEYANYNSCQSMMENKARRIFRFEGRLWIVTGSLSQYLKCHKVWMQRVVEADLHFDSVYTYKQKCKMRDGAVEAMKYDNILIRYKGKEFVVKPREIELTGEEDQKQLDLFEDAA
jgi:hypothetical protein